MALRRQSPNWILYSCSHFLSMCVCILLMHAHICIEKPAKAHPVLPVMCDVFAVGFASSVTPTLVQFCSREKHIWELHLQAIVVCNDVVALCHLITYISCLSLTIHQKSLWNSVTGFLKLYLFVQLMAGMLFYLIDILNPYTIFLLLEKCSLCVNVLFKKKGNDTKDVTRCRLW